jgi:hypothetical protein
MHYWTVRITIAKINATKVLVKGVIKFLKDALNVLVVK